MQPSSFPETLKKLRGGAGVTQEDLAKLSTVSSSAICRWEKGQSTPKRRDDIEKIDAALGAQGQLIRLWSALTSGSTLPPWMQGPAELEEAASRIEYLSPVLVPGLLQCQEYAEHVFREGQPLGDAAEISRLAVARCNRYDHLRHDRDPWVTAVFPESALTGMPEQTRRAQAKHLLQLAEHPRTSLHLVPSGTLLVGITSPVLMVRLASGGRAASSDHISGNVPLDEQVDWDRLDELSKRAFASALPTDQSLSLLGDLAQ
ncbi:helix-turn-helix domain-containing protein [Nocardiopsis suaedae]|uniref:Helix-turn-helix transcriptional regulator n=1 Tax=Nocardiopsis suaedae TaxID=3018444 RepID=A0ABT4TJH0_9ACTN|nr:helix-turn-helix transcriptional regulator [Nocardiopsis suaedae]MDA2804857.1 helix-turn-helix transcriptional regulator [Nocardiopsis suaedae]